MFRSVALYAIAGLLFTFAFYRGPWINGVKGWVASTFDGAFGAALGRVAGDAGALGLGGSIAVWLITGWAMQHYYLDSKIWRVSKDAQVARSLNV